MPPEKRDDYCAWHLFCYWLHSAMHLLGIYSYTGTQGCMVYKLPKIKYRRSIRNVSHGIESVPQAESYFPMADKCGMHVGRLLKCFLPNTYVPN